MKKQRAIPLILLFSVIVSGLNLYAAGEKHMDLLVETDGKGQYKVLSQKVMEGPCPPAPDLKMDEGLTYMELRDESGELLFNQTRPVSTKIMFDYMEPPTQPGGQPTLKGGTVDTGKAVINLRVPYTPNKRHTLRFSKLKARAGQTAKSGAKSAFGAAPQVPAEMALESETDLSLEAKP